MQQDAEAEVSSSVLLINFLLLAKATSIRLLNHQLSNHQTLLDITVTTTSKRVADLVLPFHVCVFCALFGACSRNYWHDRVS